MLFQKSEVGGLSSTGKSFRVVRACARCVCLVSSGQKSTGSDFPSSLFGLGGFPFSLPPCPPISYPASAHAAELTHLSTQHAAHASQDCLNRSSKAYAQVSRFRLSDVGCSRPQSKNAKPHNVVCHFPCPPFGPGGFPFSFERRHAQHHHHTVGKLA